MAFVYSVAASRFCHSAAANVFCLFCLYLNPSSNSFCLFCWSLELSVKRTVSRDPYSNCFWFIRYAILSPTANAFTYIQPIQVLFAKIYFHDACHSTKSAKVSPSTEVYNILPLFMPTYNPFTYGLVQSASVGPICQPAQLNPSASLIDWTSLPI
jgi:hypothetical protein